MRIKGKGKNPKSQEAIKKHSFEKGKSGNPSGRPKGIPSLRDRLARYMEAQTTGQTPTGSIEKMTVGDTIICALLTKSQGGDMTAIKETLERYYGKEVQPMDITQKEETIITMEERIKKYAKSD